MLGEFHTLKCPSPSRPLPGVPEELPLLVVPAVRGREHPTLVHQDTRAVEREAIEEGDLPGLRAALTRGARSLGVPIRVVSGEHRLCDWRKEVEIRAGRAGQGLSLGSQRNELGLGAQPVGWVWRGRDRMCSVCRSRTQRSDKGAGIERCARWKRSRCGNNAAGWKRGQRQKAIMLDLG